MKDVRKIFFDPPLSTVGPSNQAILQPFPTLPLIADVINRLANCRELAAQIADVVDSFLEELNSSIEEDGKRYINYKLYTSQGCTNLLCWSMAPCLMIVQSYYPKNGIFGLGI